MTRAPIALARATATTVKTGTTGLFFSFGRATRVVEPGLCYMIPFLQVVRTMPTRARTLDLPAQRVVTHDGLVFLVIESLLADRMLRRGRSRNEGDALSGEEQVQHG